MTDRLEQLLKFHEADPDDTFCTYGIAMEHANRGETDQALQWLDKTLAIDADYAYAWYQKARLLHEAGRVDEALAATAEGEAAAGRSEDTHAAEELATLREAIEADAT